MVLINEFEMTAFELTSVMAGILKFISKKGTASPSEISKNVNSVAQSTISRNLQQLSISGLIKISDVNGKQKDCILTDEGKNALKQINNGKKLMILL